MVALSLVMASWLFEYHEEVIREVKANLHCGVAGSSRARFFICFIVSVQELPCSARAQNYPTQQSKQRIVRGYSWQLLSVDWPLRIEILALYKILHKCMETVIVPV